MKCHSIGVLALTLTLSGCAPARQPVDPATLPAPVATERHPLAGFWKDHCEDDFGLSIAPAAGDMYSVSFCGPGGCFEPGSYRPDTLIVGDPSYRVIDADTLDVGRSDGEFQRYLRCPVAL